MLNLLQLLLVSRVAGWFEVMVEPDAIIGEAAPIFQLVDDATIFNHGGALHFQSDVHVVLVWFCQGAHAAEGGNVPLF